MANVNLDDIQTRSVLSKSDIFNMMVVHGKFSLSYRTSLSSMNGFFLSTDELKRMNAGVDELYAWVETRVSNLATKVYMEDKFMLLSEAKYWHNRLLTDSVMESVCAEYINRKALSAVIDEGRKKGQLTATELANALSWIASIMKSQAIMNDTEIQLNSIENENLIQNAEIMSQAMAAMQEQFMAIQSKLEEMSAALEELGESDNEDHTYDNLSSEGKQKIAALVKTPGMCPYCSAGPRDDIYQHICKSHKDVGVVATIIANYTVGNK